MRYPQPREGENYFELGRIRTHTIFEWLVNISEIKLVDLNFSD